MHSSLSSQETYPPPQIFDFVDRFESLAPGKPRLGAEKMKKSGFRENFWDGAKILPHVDKLELQSSFPSLNREDKGTKRKLPLLPFPEEEQKEGIKRR